LLTQASRSCDAIEASRGIPSIASLIDAANGLVTPQLLWQAVHDLTAQVPRDLATLRSTFNTTQLGLVNLGAFYLVWTALAMLTAATDANSIVTEELVGRLYAESSMTLQQTMWAPGEVIALLNMLGASNETISNNWYIAGPTSSWEVWNLLQGVVILSSTPALWPGVYVTFTNSSRITTYDYTQPDYWGYVSFSAILSEAITWVNDDTADFSYSRGARCCIASAGGVCEPWEALPSYECSMIGLRWPMMCNFDPDMELQSLNETTAPPSAWPTAAPTAPTKAPTRLPTAPTMMPSRRPSTVRAI
jgi:hypothetical protein